MQLSVRMQAVADLVTGGGRVADIGTDHGYVPVYLVQQGIASRAIAMDVRPGPLSHARANIEKYGLADRIELRLSDGLQKLGAGEADSVIAAGMGGLLMVRILEEGLMVLDTVRECILQPQSDVDSVRRFLHDHDFRIIQEEMVIDGGKYYVMMKAVHGTDCPWDRIDDLYGRLLMTQGHPVLKAWLERESKMTAQIIEQLRLQTSEKSMRRLRELQETYKLLQEALTRTNNGSRTAI